MRNKLQELLSQNVRRNVDVEKLVDDVLSLVNTKTTTRRKNEDVVINDDVYKFCNYTQKYHHERDIVKNHSYCKAAYAIWHRLYLETPKMKSKSADLMSQYIETQDEKLLAEAKKLLQDAESLWATRNLVETYESCGGYTLDELKQLAKESQE